MEIKASIDAADGFNALRRARLALRSAGAALGVGTEEMRKEAVRLAAKADGAVARGIQRSRISEYVQEIVSRADHGGYLEQGTGLYGPLKRALNRRQLPDAGIARIAAWIKRKGITPRMGNRTLVSNRRLVNAAAELPWLIARKIARDGTRAQPYMAPAFAAKQGRVQQLVREAIARSLAPVSA